MNREPSATAPHFYWEETEDRTDLCGPGLRTAFVRTGATWAHAVLLPNDDGLELARAVETDPGRDDPRSVVSPVYQDLQRHPGGTGSGLCLLLTGNRSRSARRPGA